MTTPDPKSFLVTGATGFIGKRLVARLADVAQHVYCVVDEDRGQRARLPVASGVVPVEMGTTGQDTKAIVSRLSPDIVVNLVAQGVDPASRDSRGMISGNLGFISDLILALRDSSPEVVLHVGSWSEYADPVDNEPIREDHPIWPTSLYGAAKATASIYGNALARELGIPFVTLRLFNVYGPGESQGRLFPHLITNLGNLDHADLTSAEQIRDFTFVDDIVDAVLTAGAAGLEPYTAYNICSGRPVTVHTVAERVADIMGAPRHLLRFGAIEQRHDEPPFMVGDNSRFHEATGWRPRVTLDDGIRLTIESRAQETTTP